MLEQNIQHSESLNAEEKQKQLKKIILEMQNPNEKGYYMFDQWKNLNYQLFGSDHSYNKKTMNLSAIDQTIINMWRILKLINFGDDYVPTGLIYDTLLTITKPDGQPEEIEIILKNVFFKFIEFNGKHLTREQREQLAFFKVIKPLVEGYRKLIAKKLKQNQLEQQQSQKSEEQDQSSRHEQLYRLHNVFTYKKNLSKLKKIQQEFKQCTFEPQLVSASLDVEARYQNQKKAAPKLKIIEQEEQAEQKVFTAQPIPVYPAVSPNGLQEHLDRMQKSREIKKINSLKPSKNCKDVGQFSITKRNNQRKQNSFQDCKILFIIKVEVGKRIYRIKVRQNMSISDTVKAIEMMMGFQHPQIEDIVKSYYMNWEKRLQKISQSRAEQSIQN